MSSPHEPSQIVVPVIEEELEVDRRVVDTGHTLRVRKHVQEDVVDLDQRLVREYAEVERVPVGRVIDEPVGIRQEGEVTIVPVMEERLVVRRELVLVEEVRIVRRRESRAPDKEVTLRRESVVVERFDPDSGEWRPADPVTASATAAGAGPPTAAR
jgi:stress response protein YsnF